MTSVTHLLECRNYTRRVASHVAQACSTTTHLPAHAFLPDSIQISPNGFSRTRAVAKVYRNNVRLFAIMLKYSKPDGWVIESGEFYNAVTTLLFNYNIAFDDTDEFNQMCSAGQSACLSLKPKKTLKFK